MKIGFPLTQEEKRRLDKSIRAALLANPRMARRYAETAINPKFYGTLVINGASSSP